MMVEFKKVAVIARDPDSIIDLKKDLSDFEYDDASPDFVVCHGGDGTFLYAEQKYPGIPKLHIRDSEICAKCIEGKAYELISKILRKEFVIEKNMKLESNINDKTWLATNNFAIRNSIPINAIRFFLRIMIQLPQRLLFPQSLNGYLVIFRRRFPLKACGNDM